MQFHNVLQQLVCDFEVSEVQPVFIGTVHRNYSIITVYQRKVFVRRAVE